MKQLLIVGAGGHGKVVAEVAKDLGYEEIAFLDDNSLEAIGKTSDAEKLRNQFGEAFVGIGNNVLRGNLIKMLEDNGYEIPSLIHPTAYISRTAVIDAGTIIEPKAIVNANSHVGGGSIISVGAIVDHDVEIGMNCHINAGAIVKAGSKVPPESRIDVGQVAEGV